MTELTCLSVRQPYCGWFFHPDDGIAKKFENRSWKTNYRGTIYLHASRHEPPPSAAQITELEKDCSREYIDNALSLWQPIPGLPPSAALTGAIIGSVDLIEIIDRDSIDLLAEVPQRAKSLPWDVARCLYPSQRDGFLEKWKVARKFLADITPEQYDLHVDGPECWLVKNPRLLAEPIITGGKLNLWKYQVEPERLRFVDQTEPVVTFVGKMG